MTPSEADLKKKKKQLEDLMKQIDPETGKSTEYKMVMVVRSAIRKAWMRSPTKLAYLNSRVVPDMDNSTRTKWKIQCECCGGWFKLDQIEVDHIEGNHSFKQLSDFENYFNKILMVGFEGLQILCKDTCHANKTYSEKNGCSVEEAAIIKKAVAIQKLKQDVDFIRKNGYTPASNQAKRKQQLIEVLTKEQKEDE